MTDVSVRIFDNFYDLNVQLNLARWKIVNDCCLILCGFKFRSIRIRLESFSLVVVYMKEIQRFQLIINLIGFNSVIVVKNVKIFVGCFNGYVVFRFRDMMLKGFLV